MPGRNPDYVVNLLRRFWRYVACKVPDLPIIALTNHCPITLDVFWTPVLAFNGCTPCSGRPHLFAIRTYDVGRILIDRDAVVAELHVLEPVCPKFLNSLPTESRSILLHINPVLREVRGNSDRIIFVKCIGMFFYRRDKLLT